MSTTTTPPLTVADLSAEHAGLEIEIDTPADAPAYGQGYVMRGEFTAVRDTAPRAGEDATRFVVLAPCEHSHMTGGAHLDPRRAVRVLSTPPTTA